MFPSSLVPSLRQSAVSRRMRAALRGWLLSAAAALSVSMLAGVPLMAQTAHFGSVVTLGSGFSTPTGVAVDGNGNVYVADNGNSVVKEILAVNGRIPPSPTINTLGSGFANPFTVAVDKSGNVYVTDYGNHAVKEILAAGGYTTVRTLIANTSFIFGSAVDARGDVFYSEYGKNLVKELVAVNGSIPADPKVMTLGGGFNIPAGVAVDANGNIFIGDQNNNAAKEILASSGYTTTVTLATGFSTPDGIAVDKFGNVYVANDGGNSVEEILAVNGVIPVSPTILTLGSGFLQPFDVAVDNNGDVYVADRGNNAVKEIQIAGGNFGQVNVGTTTLSPITLSFTFDTSGTLGSTSVVTLGNTGMDFYDSGGGTCVANTAYTAGQVCTVNAKFAPLVPGPRNGAVELLSTSGSLLASGQLQGIGVGPQVTFANTSIGNFLPGSSSGAGSGFNNPGGVAVDATGNIFVGDSNNNAVREILAAGGWTTVNTLASGFSSPNGVALDGGGNVYVADTFNDAVKQIIAAGGYATVNNLGSGFSNPYGVAVDGNGDVYVADFGNDAVKEILATNGIIPASPVIRTLASGLNGPDGVAVDGSGNVFVANYGDGTIDQIVAVNGSIPAAPMIKTIATGFSGPSNLSVDGIGDLFLTDTGNNEVDEIVGAGGSAGISCGGRPCPHSVAPALRMLGSGFSFPGAVAVSGSGFVIVADSGNNAVDLLFFENSASLTFPSTSMSSSSSQTETVTNDGNAPLIFPLPGSGTNPSVPANFAWDASSTCKQTTPSSPQAFQLPGGASCNMVLDFKPTITGPLGGNAVLTDNNLNLSGAQQSIFLSGTGTTAPGAPATLTSPSPSSAVFGPRVEFTWKARTGATGYTLQLGTTIGASNLYRSGSITATSATPTNLPINGETIHARLITEYGTRQVYTDYVFITRKMPLPGRPR